MVFLFFIDSKYCFFLPGDVNPLSVMTRAIGDLLCTSPLDLSVGGSSGGQCSVTVICACSTLVKSKLANVFRDSGHPFVTLSLPLLTSDKDGLESVVDTVLRVSASHRPDAIVESALTPPRWRTNTAFRSLLLDTGGLPRAVEVLLNIILGFSGWFPFFFFLFSFLFFEGLRNRSPGCKPLLLVSRSDECSQDENV